jgi:hypothetical protein
LLAYRLSERGDPYRSCCRAPTHCSRTTTSHKSVAAVRTDGRPSS